MRYNDLESLKRKIDSLVLALDSSNERIEENAENLNQYKEENAFNLAELNDIVINGISFDDLDEDLKNSIINAKNAGLDITELIEKDNYLDEIKANKTDVYTQTEVDSRLSNFYTKNEVDNEINNAVSEIDIQQTVDILNNYIDSNSIAIDELTRQVNNLKKTYHNAIEIASINDFDDIIITYPNEVVLPTEASIELSDGTSQTVGIQWKKEEIDFTIGEYDIEGVLILPLTIVNSHGLVPVIKVIVNGSPTAIDEVVIQELGIDYGTNKNDLNLSDEVVVRLFNGNEFSLPVTWDLSRYEQYSLEPQVIYGEISLIEGITNPKDLFGILNMTIVEKHVVDIENVTLEYERDDTITFDLPNILNVVLNTGENRNYSVIWNNDIDTTQLGSFEISGEFTNIPISIVPDVTPVCNINLIENQKNIVQVGRVADIEVAYDVEFEAIDLEEQIEVVTYDGEVSKVTVSWDRGTYDQTTPGNYPITGRLIYAPLKNFNNMKLERVIRVSDEDFYEYDWSFKVGIPNSVSEISEISQLINKNITEKDIYGTYDEDIDDYLYNKRKIEVRYLGSTLQEFPDITLDIDESKIVKSGIIDTYGEDGLRIPLGTQSDALKDAFDNNVESVNERSLRSFDYYAGDVLTFENKTLSNQILLIRKAKNNYIKGE